MDDIKSRYGKLRRIATFMSNAILVDRYKTYKKEYCGKWKAGEENSDTKNIVSSFRLPMNCDYLMTESICLQSRADTLCFPERVFM